MRRVVIHTKKNLSDLSLFVCVYTVNNQKLEPGRPGDKICDLMWH